MINETEKINMSYDEAVAAMKEEIGSALSLSPVIIRDYMRHLNISRGKYIRALSLLACAQDEDGTVHINAVYAAAAVEILHLATLVHDDIIDDADTRRGNLSLQKKFGKRCAVICGDYLFCLALRTAGRVRDREKYLKTDLPDYMSRICLGELYQHINNNNLDISAYKYLKIISGKTAALFEASFYLGAVLSESHKARAGRFARLGRYVGMVFQLTDDCMNFEAENADEKPVHSDYEQGVITLPLIYAFDKIGSLKQKARLNKLSPGEIYAAVIKAGGTAYARSVAEKYRAKALKLIDELCLADDKKEKMLFILDKASRRSK